MNQRELPRDADLERQFNPSFKEYEEWRSAQTDAAPPVQERKEEKKKGFGKMDLIFIVLGVLVVSISLQVVWISSLTEDQVGENARKLYPLLCAPTFQKPMNERGVFFEVGHRNSPGSKDASNQPDHGSTWDSGGYG